MSAERKRDLSPKEWKTTFEESFNSLTNRIASALQECEFKAYPIFSAAPNRMLILDRNRFWSRVIDRGEATTITGLPRYVCREYVILTTQELWERARVLKEESVDEMKEINNVAEGILENNRQEIEANVLSLMRKASRDLRMHLAKKRRR